jgi:hypothetical protein
VRTLLGWLAAAFIAWWIITAPLGAAATAQHIGHLATQAATSLADMIQHL